MTGLERNGDVVRMASYAPLFAHVDAWQWTPNLIWVNNLQSYGTPNYYVQKMFANNPGDTALPTTLDAAGAEKLYASAARDTASGEVILKVVNGGKSSASIALDFSGAGKIASSASVSTLTGSLLDENSFAAPQKVFPQESKLEITAPQFEHAFPANSLTVLRLKVEK
jgi:alpha-N-arabinofuranosidase